MAEPVISTAEGLKVFEGLGVALAIGLLIGVERGWHSRAAAEGTRVAGLRTFGLIGFLGGLWGLLAEELGTPLLAVAFAALAALVVTAYFITSRGQGDYGITTAVATLVTFALGALAVRGYEVVASAGAVLTATLLGFKPLLHGWVERIEERELYAALKLLLISVVLLPVLPDRGFGPWQALNPYEIWWLVVLIAAISFAGYLAVKIAGPRVGVALTGFFGGLASSTATTLSFARFGRGNPEMSRILSAGVVVSASTMFPRMLLVASVVNPTILAPLAWPVALMTAAGYIASAWLWRATAERAAGATPRVENPSDIKTALQFGFLLAVVILLAKGAREWLGEAGLYLVAAVSGITDVDAITVSLSRMARDELASEIAVHGIVLAAVVNTFAKGTMAWAIGGRAMGLRVMAAFIAIVGAGVAGFWLG